jgi:ParB family chromosome partitioning protein
MITEPLAHRQVELVPIDLITVLNPRVRGRKQHKEIIENIRTIGLKRPITVSRRNAADGTCRYDLVCGQGRLEAYQALGQQFIPAFVTETSEENCLLFGLVENVARRQHLPIELMREVGNLRKRGYSESEVAEMIGVSASWVQKINSLLARGEDRLLAAVETGVLSLSAALTIASATHSEAQEWLTEAYEKGEFRGKRLAILRRLLNTRMRNRVIPDARVPGRHKPKKVSITDLRRIYEQEADKQRLMAKKVEVTHTKLVFAIQALKELLSDPGFFRLLQAEGMETMPKVIRDHMVSGLQP